MPGGLQPSVVHCSHSGEKLRAVVVLYCGNGCVGKDIYCIHDWGGREGGLECSELDPDDFLKEVPLFFSFFLKKNEV